MEETGKRQFKEFFEEPLVLAKKPIDGVIKSKRIKFPRKNNLQKSKPNKS